MDLIFPDDGVEHGNGPLDDVLERHAVGWIGFLKNHAVLHIERFGRQIEFIGGQIQQHAFGLAGGFFNDISIAAQVAGPIG